MCLEPILLTVLSVFAWKKRAYAMLINNTAGDELDTANEDFSDMLLI